MKATVQNNDFIGTAAADISDHTDLNKFLASRGIDTDWYEVIGEIFKVTKKEYQSYEQWVNFDRVKAEKLAKISPDEILTDTFHFFDKYGWLILLIIKVAFMLFALSIKK